jgi:hypothetical protein
MFTLSGKYQTATIMVDEVETECISHIMKMINHPAFSNPVVIQPDTHEGKGAVIGFTMEMTDKIVPACIGVDIACGLVSAKLSGVVFKDNKFTNKVKKHSVTRDEIDTYIRTYVPFGNTIHNKPVYDMKLFPWHKAAELNRQFVMALERKTGEHMPHTKYDYEWFKNKCNQIGMDVIRAERSIGTLGGGKMIASSPRV